ncbi:MAG: type I polyketide synthase [Chitinophagales bacterium]
MQEILQKSLIKIKKLEQELEQANQNTVAPKENIAIIGTGVRLAQNINSTKKLFELLISTKNAISKIPSDRFNVDEIYHADNTIAGKTVSQYGAFLQNDVRAFDAEFFGISPREAKSIDPLQRMILEVVYEAIENAGIASDTLKGTATGVFIALGNSDYIQARFRSGNLETIDIYDTTGIPFGTACGRVSYLYDLKGTSYSLDAACASSLVAVHLACEDLNKKIIDTAIVASANLLLTPEPFIGLSKLGSLSSTNQCKAFADDADGYIRGEGCGVVVLKRQSDAEHDNDNIEVLINGSAVKHNGNSNGFTAPNPQIQIETIQAALRDANVNANEISYVEAHGIGNKFTDAIEIQSIYEAYKERNDSIYIGSVKANIGHLEAATGMPMLFKIIEILKNKTIPAQINITKLNSGVDWNSINAKVATESIALNDNQPLHAAINLSGYSGTNVHMIFEAAKPKQQSDEINAPYLFVLSAKNEISLKNVAQKYLDDKTVFDNNTRTEICYTLQKGRNHFDYRLAIKANTKEEIIAGLQAFINDEKPTKYKLSKPNTEINNSTAFLFTGQGAQYHGMCKTYYDTFDTFKNTIDECDLILLPTLKVSIKDILWNEEIDKNQINQTQFTQPSLFVVEYALAKLWMSFGIQPNALIGHSIGELTALTIAKAITLKDALQIVVARAALMQSLPVGIGGMASVFCTEEEIKPFLENTHLDLAAINATKNCTVSGKKEDIALLLEKLKEQKIKAVSLNVSHAFHSSLMEPILEKFEQFASQFSFKQPEIPVVSNVHGKVITKDDLNGKYFSDHIRKAVLFANDLLYAENELHINTFLECGPNPVLINLAKRTSTNENAVWIASANKDDNNMDSFYEALQQLYCNGATINWNILYQNKKINRVALPNYAWNWKVYWENPVRQQSLVNSHRSIEDKSILNSNAQLPISNDQLLMTNKPKVTRETLLAYMQIEASKVLGLEAGQKVDIHKTYREQGFDSMMSGEFLSLMEKHIGSELKMEIIHQYNTPKDLHRYLIDTYFGGGEIDTTQAITMADIMFAQEMESTHNGDWHEVKETDGLFLKWFKKFDKMIPSVKE